MRRQRWYAAAALCALTLVISQLPGWVRLALPDAPTPPPVIEVRSDAVAAASIPDATDDLTRLSQGKVVSTAEASVTGVSVAGVTWAKGVQAPVLLYRTFLAGVASPWAIVAVETAEPAEGSTTSGSEPITITDADRIQVAAIAEGSLDVHLSVFASPGTYEPLASELAATTSTSTQIAALRPAIKTRAQWGANEQIISLPYEYGIISGVMIHHDAGSNNYTQADVPAILRSIQAYHVKTRGWKDMGYNVLVDKFGTAWEGRGGGIDQAVIGGHGYGVTNNRVFGLAFVGNYQTAKPTTAMISKAEDIIAWKFAANGVDPYGKTFGSGGQDGGSTFLNAISGHRDENNTDCPGQYVYPLLSQVRAAVKTRLNGVAYPITQPLPTPVTVLPKPDPVTGKITLPVNGQLDKATVIELQRWLGVAIDGVWGAETNKALQKKTGATVTGVRDTQTITHLQAAVRATVTGYLDSQTIIALQVFLNALPGPKPTPTASTSPTQSSTPSLSPTPTMQPSATASPTQSSPSPTATDTPSATPAVTPSATPTSSPSATQSPTQSPTPSATPTPTASPSTSPSTSPTPTASVSPTPVTFTATYSAHVQGIGWMTAVTGPQVAGTTGRSLRLEALKLKVASSAHSGDLQWRGHVQGFGWQPWTTSSNYIGTVGKSLRLEAFQITLTGDLAAHYRVAYKAYVEGIGWQGIVYDGATAGTTGQARRIEAVSITLIPKA